jgi:hypothetical protein
MWHVSYPSEKSLETKNKQKLKRLKDLWKKKTAAKRAS